MKLSVRSKKPSNKVKRISLRNVQHLKIIKSETMYEEEVKHMRSSSDYWGNFFSDDAEEYRRKEWNNLDAKINVLCNKYSWAVPDDRALKIIGTFSPLVEIGAGKGYWAKLLRQQGVDILAYDKYIFNVAASKLSPKDGMSCYTEVLEGGPEVLLQPTVKNRSLFLCYPDDRESMAIVALENFANDYVIYVGESIHTGTLMGSPVAPFGRTSSAEFQVALTESFHCLLVCRLQTTYPNSKDCISVWKRTKYIPGKEAPISGDLEDKNNNQEANSNSPTLSAVEFIGPADLEKLRSGDNRDKSSRVGSSSKIRKATAVTSSDDSNVNVRKKKSKISSADHSSEDDISRLREAALDHQYGEDYDTKWASIPADELLPIDRAAPCLMHLLSD